MDGKEIVELANKVATIPSGDDLELFENALADRRGFLAKVERQRLESLRNMSDVDVVDAALREFTSHADEHDADGALQMLRDAGFERVLDKPAPLRFAIGDHVVDAYADDAALLVLRDALTRSPLQVAWSK